MRFVVLKGAALLGGVNALHTAFPEDAIEEYKVQGMYTCILISFNILMNNVLRLFALQ